MVDIIAAQKTPGGRSYVSENQFNLKLSQKVADRVIEELPNRNGMWAPPSELLRGAVHGGPGIGKNQVVQDVMKYKLFNHILQWQQGHHYQVVSLQAVMTDVLKGDTILHACGIPIRKRDSDGEVFIRPAKEIGYR